MDSIMQKSLQWFQEVVTRLFVVPGLRFFWRPPCFLRTYSHRSSAPRCRGLSRFPQKSCWTTIPGKRWKSAGDSCRSKNMTCCYAHAKSHQLDGLNVSVRCCSTDLTGLSRGPFLICHAGIGQSSYIPYLSFPRSKASS